MLRSFLIYGWSPIRAACERGQTAHIMSVGPAEDAIACPSWIDHELRLAEAEARHRRLYEEHA